jgi:hypothetical protein
MASPAGWIFDRDTVVEYIAVQRAEIKARESGHDTAEASTHVTTSNPLFDNPNSNNKAEKCFWVSPDAISTAGTLSSERFHKLDSHPRCPMSGTKLRHKDLVPVKFESTTNKEAEGGIYCCAITKRPIGHHQALLIKPSGVVVLESAWTDRTTCPVSGEKLSPDDIIKLHKGRPIQS